MFDAHVAQWTILCLLMSGGSYTEDFRGKILNKILNWLLKTKEIFNCTLIYLFDFRNNKNKFFFFLLFS